MTRQSSLIIHLLGYWVPTFAGMTMGSKETEICIDAFDWIAPSVPTGLPRGGEQRRCLVINLFVIAAQAGT